MYDYTMVVFLYMLGIANLCDKNWIKNTCLCWYCLSILKYLSIHALYNNIDNVGYNIDIETYYKIDPPMLSSIKIKNKI